MYRLDVSKVVGPSWFLVPSDALGGLVGSRNSSLPWSSGVQDNLEGVYAISQPMCKIFRKGQGVL